MYGEIAYFYINFSLFNANYFAFLLKISHFVLYISEDLRIHK